MSKRIQRYDPKTKVLIAVVLGLITTLLTLMVSVNLPKSLQFPVPFLAGLIVYYIGFKLLDEKTLNQKRSNQLSKILAYAIVASIAVSLYTATKSLWISPGDTSTNRFVYENIATGFGFAAIVLTFLLTGLQKDLYWYSKVKKGSLDEREMKQRQETFEVSYRYIVGILILGLWFFSNTAFNIPAIISLNYGMVPGHLYWLPGNIVCLIVAMPLLLAAWKDQLD